MVAEDAESSSHHSLAETRKRENKLDDAARVRHYRSEPLPSAREAVVSTIRRNLRVNRLHAFKIIARIILCHASDDLYHIDGHSISVALEP